MILIVGPTPSFQRRMVFKRVFPNQVNRANQIELLASGKGINCARSILRLGGAGMNLLFLGGDSGKWMEKQLKTEGLKSIIIRVPSQTRMCCTFIEEETNHVTELVENAAKVRPLDVKLFIHSYAECLRKKPKIVILAGSLPNGMPPKIYSQLIRMAHQKNLLTLVDTQEQPLLHALKAKPFLVKPNKDELKSVTGSNCDTLKKLFKAADFLHRGGAIWVLITNGAKPTLLSNGKERWLFYPPKIKMRNPIGSGDSTMGGLAVAFTKGKTIPEAVRFAIACGAANAASNGYGRINKNLVKRFEKKVKMKYQPRCPSTTSS